MNRRDFLAASATVLSSGGLRPPLASAEDKPMIPVVDTHQHLWNWTS